MGRQATILQVFVASPSDLLEERIALASVIGELNQTIADRIGAYLELIKWETHAVPGIGTDPQAVINEAIGKDYDIFIGILSTRFGSQTPRAGSGTEEEFERAYARFKENPNQIRIMFYFKDPEVRASELDLDQYALVRGFQKSLSEKGLYSTFSTTDEFTSLVRMHLNRQLQDWGDGKWGSQKLEQATMENVLEKVEVTPQVTQSEGDEADIGFLDLIEMVNENLGNANLCLNRMSNAITELGEKVQDSTPRLNDAATNGDIAKGKLIINNIAQIMDEFSQRLNAELPIFSRSYSSAIDAISRSTTLWESDFKSEDLSSIRTNHNQILTLVEAITGALDSMTSMQQTIASLPRMTSVFNKAKRNANESLMNLNRELASSLNLTQEIQKELKRILERDNA